MNADDIIGAGLTPIESVGLVTLAVDGGGNLRVNGELITYNGGPVGYNASPDAVWRFVAAEAIGGVNTVVLQHSSDFLHFWRMDASWNQLSGEGWLAPNAPGFYTAEIDFGVDLNADGIIGVGLTPIESVGLVTLAVDGGGNLRANGELITYNGSPVAYDASPAALWQFVAADVLKGVNTVVLKDSGGFLYLWDMDDSWGQPAMRGGFAPGSKRFYATETAFGLDFNADGTIGSGPTPIESAGSVTLGYDGNGNLRANDTLITYNGGPVRHNTAPDAVWRFVAAEAIGGVNTVVLQHSSGFLHFWRMDASWTQLSGEGWLAPDVPGFYAAEIDFGVDFNRNSFIGS